MDQARSLLGERKKGLDEEGVAEEAEHGAGVRGSVEEVGVLGGSVAGGGITQRCRRGPAAETKRNGADHQAQPARRGARGLGSWRPMGWGWPWEWQGSGVGRGCWRGWEGRARGRRAMFAGAGGACRGCGRGSPPSSAGLEKEHAAIPDRGAAAEQREDELLAAMGWTRKSSAIQGRW